MLLIALIISVITKAQFNLAPRIGMNEKARLVFGMDVAYRFKNFEPALTISEVQHTAEAGYFGARLGYAIPITKHLNLMPIVGRSFRAESFDKNEFQTGNRWLMAYGVRVERMLHRSTAVFMQADYVGQAQLSIGIKF